MTLIPTDLNEVYRYLGFHGITPTPEMTGIIQECLEKLQEVSAPRSFYLYTPLEIIPAGEVSTEEVSAGEAAEASAPEAASVEGASAPLLRFAGMEVRSKGLARNLAGCREVCLLAATIGPGVDLLIRRAQVSAMSRAVIYQAAGAAMIEAYVDGLNEQIRQEAHARGLFLRPRFSPGYGDFSLGHQTDFARVLEMQKTCGITLGSSLLMTPSKSVTAVIGLSDHGTDCREPGCEECAHPCEYRRV